MINYQAIRQLEILKESDSFTESVLINLEDQSKLFTFLWNPVSYIYSAQNTYQTRYAMFGKKPHTRFQNAQVGTLTISRLEFRTPCYNRNMNSLKSSLDSLRFPAEGKLSPPMLAWVTGQYMIQPLYLQALTIEQLDQIDGNSTALGVSLTFIGADQIQF